MSDTTSAESWKQLQCAATQWYQATLHWGDQGPDGLWATYPLVLQVALKCRVQEPAA